MGKVSGRPELDGIIRTENERKLLEYIETLEQEVRVLKDKKKPPATTPEYRAGRKAAKAGLNLTANPYAYRTLKRKWWYDGWYDGWCN